MNIEEDLTSLKEIVAIRKERCHGFIESDSCLISTKRLETLLTAYEKEKEKNKDVEDTLKQTQNSWYEDTKVIEKQSKEIEELKEDKYGLEEEVQIQAKNIMLCEEALCEMQDKIKAKIERKFLEAKGLYERGVQPQAQYTMKLLRDLEESLLEKE